MHVSVIDNSFFLNILLWIVNDDCSLLKEKKEKNCETHLVMKWFYEIWEDSSYIQKYDAKGNLLECMVPCLLKKKHNLVIVELSDEMTEGNLYGIAALSQQIIKVLF